MGDPKEKIAEGSCDENKMIKSRELEGKKSSSTDAKRERGSSERRQKSDTSERNKKHKVRSADENSELKKEKEKSSTNAGGKPLQDNLIACSEKRTNSKELGNKKVSKLDTIEELGKGTEDVTLEQTLSLPGPADGKESPVDEKSSLLDLNSNSSAVIDQEGRDGNSSVSEGKDQLFSTSSERRVYSGKDLNCNLILNERAEAAKRSHDSERSEHKAKKVKTEKEKSSLSSKDKHDKVSSEKRTNSKELGNKKVSKLDTIEELGKGTEDVTLEQTLSLPGPADGKESQVDEKSSLLDLNSNSSAVIDQEGRDGNSSVSEGKDQLFSTSSERRVYSGKDLNCNLILNERAEAAKRSHDSERSEHKAKKVKTEKEKSSLSSKDKHDKVSSVLNDTKEHAEDNKPPETDGRDSKEGSEQKAKKSKTEKEKSSHNSRDRHDKKKKEKEKRKEKETIKENKETWGGYSEPPDIKEEELRSLADYTGSEAVGVQGSLRQERDSEESMETKGRLKDCKVADENKETLILNKEGDHDPEHKKEIERVKEKKSSKKKVKKDKEHRDGHKGEKEGKKRGEEGKERKEKKSKEDSDKSKKGVQKESEKRKSSKDGKDKESEKQKIKKEGEEKKSKTEERKEKQQQEEASGRKGTTTMARSGSFLNTKAPYSHLLMSHCLTMSTSIMMEMTKTERKHIKDLEKCDFKEIHKYFVDRTEEKKALPKEKKQELKAEADKVQQEFGFCLLDGHREKIGNFKVEPPGLFRGRGIHPKMGMLKKRLQPEDVIINCSKDSKIPEPPEGHRWKEVRHDNTVTWLASWTENVQGSIKYVMLNPSSKLKGEKDWQKFEMARKLKGLVDSIRLQYRSDWKAREMKQRQRGVALYFIDKLALRVGNEKDESETADTVGCCSLRLEHIKLHKKLGDDEYVVEFDFLGKDSIRYYNKVPVEKPVFKNLQLFMNNKNPEDDLFDRLTTDVVNKYLRELMDGLSAKVFRTFNASITLQQQLMQLTNPDDTVAEKILSYNRANRAVAILCNHQRAAPKSFEKSMENLQAKIEAKRQQLEQARIDLKKAKVDYEKKKDEKSKKLMEKKAALVKRLEEQLKKLQLQVTDREENKQIALGTSKLNYLDPRISVAWCKKFGVPIEKIYTKTHRDKFAWAIHMTDEDFEF
ncbi:DNA topoisomerase I, mitochondrial [Acipenser ruthenus]|uniref:DNA topoisomerase I n=1 Tax=Acipenser ruthenus TaxID=7906 RepID=A0A444TVZ2_ACIRT|nr:DNA topoisomerase I, mitochondrial [Acipenser ruthenus]